MFNSAIEPEKLWQLICALKRFDSNFTQRSGTYDKVDWCFIVPPWHIQTAFKAMWFVASHVLRRSTVRASKKIERKNWWIINWQHFTRKLSEIDRKKPQGGNNVGKHLASRISHDTRTIWIHPDQNNMCFSICAAKIHFLNVCNTKSLILVWVFNIFVAAVFQIFAGFKHAATF